MGFGNLHQSDLEEAEKLEQLRLLHADIPIHITKTESMTKGVDTEADLAYVREALAGGAERPSIAQRLAGIRLIVTDIDGVLTNGDLFIPAKAKP